MNNGLDIVFSTASIESILNKELVKESNIYDFELYQLIIDALHYNCRTGDSIENFLYYWIYDFSSKENNWRIHIGNQTAEHLAYVIKKVKMFLLMDNPNVLDVIEEMDNNCIVSVHRHFVIING